MDFDGLEQNFNQDLTGSSQPLHRLMRRARRAYADGDFESALRILEALVRAIPDSTTILYPLACTQIRLGQYHESLELSNRLDRLGDTRGRHLRDYLNAIRASDPAGWEQSAARKPKAQSSIGSEHGHYGANRLMMNVHVSGPSEDTLALIRVARLHEVNYMFTNEVTAGVAPIFITDNVDSTLVCVDRSRGIRVSTYQREGICTYTGLDNGTFLLLCSILGTTQWRTLSLNPLLVAEDFNHGPACRCLFSHQACKEDFALVLENPEVCPSCLAFYRCLGAEREVDTLTSFLKIFRTEFLPHDSSSLA